MCSYAGVQGVPSWKTRSIALFPPNMAFPKWRDWKKYKYIYICYPESLEGSEVMEQVSRTKARTIFCRRDQCSWSNGQFLYIYELQEEIIWVLFPTDTDRSWSTTAWKEWCVIGLSEDNRLLVSPKTTAWKEWCVSDLPEGNRLFSPKTTTWKEWCVIARRQSPVGLPENNRLKGIMRNWSPRRQSPLIATKFARLLLCVSRRACACPAFRLTMVFAVNSNFILQTQRYNLNFSINNK